MHIKGKYSWLKHLDFMVLDILSLAVAFVMAIGIRFGDFSRVTSQSWKTLLLIACLMDLLASCLQTLSAESSAVMAVRNF